MAARRGFTSRQSFRADLIIRIGSGALWRNSPESLRVLLLRGAISELRNFACAWSNNAKLPAGSRLISPFNPMIETLVIPFWNACPSAGARLLGLDFDDRVALQAQ